MTANPQIAKMKEASCADGYIAKPFNIDDFEYRVAGLIR
jgi:DNA-binding response OmpR family regulator